jgi:hypothetical protein
MLLVPALCGLLSTLLSTPTRSTQIRNPHLPLSGPSATLVTHISAHTAYHGLQRWWAPLQPDLFSQPPLGSSIGAASADETPAKHPGALVRGIPKGGYFSAFSQAPAV